MAGRTHLFSCLIGYYALHGVIVLGLLCGYVAVVLYFKIHSAVLAAVVFDECRN